MKIFVSAIIILVFAAQAGYAEQRLSEQMGDREFSAQLPAEKFDASVEVEVDYWLATLDSTAKFTQDGQGTEFNMKEDLGMDDSGVPGFKLKFFTGPNSDIRFNVITFAYDGDRRLEKPINFEGESYIAGTRIKSKLDVVYYGIGWAWHFASDEEGTVQFGTLVELKGLSMEASLEAPTLLQKGSASINVMFPTFGLSLNAKAADKVFFLIEFTGMSLGDYGYFIDSDIGLRYFPIKNVGVSAGYRVFDVEAKDDPDFFNFNMSGLYLGVSGRF